MQKVFLAILTLIALNNSCFGQFKPLQSFIPSNFSILDTARGDLNKDGKADMVLILRNTFERMDYDTTRPLLLLEGNGRGQYKLLARNDSVVLCLGCGGIFGDPYAGITIKNGYFSIEHYGGSNWRWTRVITFKYDIKRKEFILHRDAGYSWHVFDPNNQTENLFSKEDFDKLAFAKYSNEKAW